MNLELMKYLTMMSLEEDTDFVFIVIDFQWLK